jgi:hypothetical protein
MDSLLTLRELQIQLNLLTKNPQICSHGFQFGQSSLQPQQIEEVESLLNLNLPNSFKEVILQFEFGNLIVDQMFFAADGDYCSFLINKNRKAPGLEWLSPWWGNEARPKEILMIAGTDNYVILLNVNSENILAYPRSKFWFDNELIASNFDLLVRAAITVTMEKEITNPETYAAEICSQVGCASGCKFWREFVKGVA